MAMRPLERRGSRQNPASQIATVLMSLALILRQTRNQVTLVTLWLNLGLISPTWIFVISTVSQAWTSGSPVLPGLAVLCFGLRVQPFR